MKVKRPQNIFSIIDGIGLVTKLRKLDSPFLKFTIIIVKPKHGFVLNNPTCSVLGVTTHSFRSHLYIEQSIKGKATLLVSVSLLDGGRNVVDIQSINIAFCI